MFGNKNWEKVISKYKMGKIDAQTFVDEMKSEKLYYSTPFGENVSGQMRPWFLNKSDAEHQFYPAFLTKEHCLRFFQRIGRGPFMIVEGDLKGCLSLLDIKPTPDSEQLLAGLGLVIEPSFEQETSIPPGIRVK